MSLKNIQGLYKMICQELPFGALDNQNSTPSKRNTKDGLAKAAEIAITSEKNPMWVFKKKF